MVRGFKRVLVANRGEIAVRVIRALRLNGMESVAVFSDPDATSMHVEMADRAYHLPGAYPTETYLNARRIIDVALKAECDAIHPGYGFLSETNEFSKLCRDNSIKFIGPRPETLEISGNKLECKKLVESRGVPVIPYSKTPMETWEEASKFASEFGYPVLLKSAYGGGGRGIKEARSRSDLKDAFESSKREASASFGRFAVFVEKKLVHPRHIEVQILASDDSNEVLHLGERECSIQRRYQKLVEISPSPVIKNEDERKKLTDFAILAGRAVKYSNAGTVEFLRDSPSGEFYFIEINSRLQVEHPVTEAVTGLDLVTMQLDVASANKLPLTQKEIQFRGSAIECRINAEAPEAGFIPATGKVGRLKIPHGPGVRVDTALREGLEVSPYYDSLLAKLIVWGDNFETARRRALVSLEEFVITGVETTINFYKEVLAHESFAAGKLHTGFIDETKIIEKMIAKRDHPEARDLALASIVLSLNTTPTILKSSPRRNMPFLMGNATAGRFSDAV